MDLNAGLVLNSLTNGLFANVSDPANRLETPGRDHQEKRHRCRPTHASNAYRVKIRVRATHGLRARTAAFTSLSEARKWVLQAELEALRQQSLGKLNAKRHTLNDAIDRYVDSALPALRSRQLVGAQLAWWRGHLGRL